MAEPALWCEARCVGIYDESPVGCQETAPGAFGVRAAAKAARRAGWGTRDGKWLCPMCIRRRTRLSRLHFRTCHVCHGPLEAATTIFDAEGNAYHTECALTL